MVSEGEKRAWPGPMSVCMPRCLPQPMQPTFPRANVRERARRHPTVLTTTHGHSSFTILKVTRLSGFAERSSFRSHIAATTAISNRRARTDRSLGIRRRRSVEDALYAPPVRRDRENERTGGFGKCDASRAAGFVTRRWACRRPKNNSGRSLPVSRCQHLFREGVEYHGRAIRCAGCVD
jgi:hypothetical protein